MIDVDFEGGLFGSDLFGNPPAKKSRRAGEYLGDEIARLVWNDAPQDPPPLVPAPAGIVALDFETEDPTLLDCGSSWAFAGKGSILGMAVAWEGFEAYYPINHREGNVDARMVMSWLSDHFRRPDIKFVCANAVYDIGWARRETGLYPAGGVEDVQFMAALLDEYRLSYSLDNLSKDYLNAGKATDVIHSIADRCRVKYNDVMANLKHLPGHILAPYAATDARRTYDLHKVLLGDISDQDLETVHRLESDLILMSVDMKRRGIRVNVAEAERLSEDIKSRRFPELQADIKRETGVHVEPWEAETCERALAQRGIVCEKTRTGQPKIDQYNLSHWAKTDRVAENILRLRKMSKIQNTFLDGHILGHEYHGRIHADINQLKSEREDGSGFGTVSGRYSCTAPNLQQIPTRDKEWGPVMRSLFLPEEGQLLASLDYSSQEPRLAVHFAAKSGLRGAAEAVAQFKENPRTDYHQMVAEIANIPRSQAKAINLGCFGSDTLVLTNRGLVRIVDVELTDLLWDGDEWVSHDGVIDQGIQEVIRLPGNLDVTPDHKILYGSAWVEAKYFAPNGNIFAAARDTALKNFPEDAASLLPDISRPAATKQCVYDILNAGPRHRFTVMTSAGPLIVHNCAYGMGGAKLARSLGLETEWMLVEKDGPRSRWTKIVEEDVEKLRREGKSCVEVAGDDAKLIMKKWEDGAPFVRGLYKLAADVASKRGYIRTILGRRCRFQRGKDDKFAYTHKAMNRLCQGSAADQTKRGMLNLWNMGCVPLLTVHDELVFSVDDDREANRYAREMEQAIVLEVPSIVDVNLGETWGDIKK